MPVYACAMALTVASTHHFCVHKQARATAVAPAVLRAARCRRMALRAAVATGRKLAWLPTWCSSCWEREWRPPAWGSSASFGPRRHSYGSCWAAAAWATGSSSSRQRVQRVRLSAAQAPVCRWEHVGAATAPHRQEGVHTASEQQHLHSWLWLRACSFAAQPMHLLRACTSMCAHSHLCALPCIYTWHNRLVPER